MEKVVIAIPVRNSAVTLRATLESAIAQTHRELRILVIDNASTDESGEIVKAYAARDPRVELRRFEELVPAEDNFNRCLDEAGSELVAVLHSDDIYEPGFIAEQVAFLERHPECDVVFTHATTIDSEGRMLGERMFPDEIKGTNVLLGYDDLLSLVLKYGNFITCPSALMRTAVFKKDLGGWNGRDFGYSADLDLWLRAARKAPVGFIAKPLMSYRASDVSFSVALQKVRTVRHAIFKVIEAHYVPASADSVARWNVKFLEAKDSALICFNLMKKGEPLPSVVEKLSMSDNLRALATSSFHRHFALRIFAIRIFATLYRFGFLRSLLRRSISRIQA